ncbi:hypothetical protein FSP39_007159 [Pinctada imbricata]|uniref:Uncharacterized protein n=1 Tax=Pinctada imbricata TaxID=66713 RepID=A0AA89CA38_PINIB|nr:hypothetical protein FSP39_007159 [Pinctada imbricata]
MKRSEKQFENFSGQLKSEQEVFSKKMKENDLTKLKSEGNKIQFEFNGQILDGLDKLEARAFENKDSKAVSIIADLRKLLQTRNKHIRIADSSPAGWKTVQEYKSSEIADDSDDEKKIRSAENRALKQKTKSRVHPYRKNAYAYPSTPSAGSANQLPVQPFLAPGNQLFRPKGPRRQPQPFDICYNCFETGHWKSRCPKAAQTTSKPSHYFIFITHFSAIFTVGRWKDINVPEDQQLAELTSQIPEYCLKSRADSTQKQYRYAFNEFCKWCTSFSCKVSSLPASDTSVSSYIIHLAKVSKSSSKIQAATHAISWAHKLAGLTDPCESSLVKLVKEGTLRDTSHPVTKKEPITPDHLHKIINVYANDKSSLADLRIACMCLLSFAGFLRFSELANLKMRNIYITDSYMILEIEKSKTDKYHEGTKVFVARTNSDLCPVSLLERYILMSDLKGMSDMFVFRALTFCKKSKAYTLRSQNRPISYTRAREIVLSAFGSIGLDSSKFGLHSLRSGGATAAANAGIGDRILRNTGGGGLSRQKTVTFMKVLMRNSKYLKISVCKYFFRLSLSSK